MGIICAMKINNFELKQLVQPLQNWFASNARILPWRENPKAYYVWISEIMLQQTRVEAVKPYFDRFIKELPDVKSLAECPEDKLLKLWEGLGYYNRVRNLKIAASQIMDEYDVEEKDIINLAQEGDYLVQGMARLDEVEELLGIEFPDEDVETLNGFLINKLGRLPDDNEEISVLYEGYEFIAIEIKEHIFQQIKIKIMD